MTISKEWKREGEAENREDELAHSNVTNERKDTAARIRAILRVKIMDFMNAFDSSEAEREMDEEEEEEDE